MMAVMSTTQTIDEPFANEFVATVRARFRDSELLRDGMDWVSGCVQPPDVAIILYRDRPGGPVLGRRYLLSEYSALFGGETAQWLATEAWVSDITAPSGDGVRKDVDWADGLVRQPEEVRWLD